MSAGLQRSEMETGQGFAARAVMVLYYGDASMQIRGAATGYIYYFSRSQPVQVVDERDAMQLMQSHMFRQVPCR